MKKKDEPERAVKRELRTLYRTKRLEREQEERERKRETAIREEHVNKWAIKALRKDNKKPDKKPGPEKFIALYSFIPNTAFDSRINIPASWKPQSFNERKQHLEFLKNFVYPYPLPETLMWAVHAPEYFPNGNGGRTKSQDYIFIHLAKKWIKDIASGESFYKRNKKFFTKAQAHHFLCAKIPYTDGSSVIKQYFYAKCRARAMNHKLSMTVADVFTVKFLNRFKNNLAEGFLDLIARTPEYRYGKNMLGDICDFVLEKMQENENCANKMEAFSFSGRTITSVISLANEWHERLRREADARQAMQRVLNHNGQRNEKPVDTSRWKGMGIKQFRFGTDECIYTVTELLSAQDLLNEGRKMRNCVSSYAAACALGEKSIFSVEQIYHESRFTDKIATLEVRLSNRTLVQAKGKCNTSVTPIAMNVIARWAQENRIKIELAV